VLPRAWMTARFAPLTMATLPANYRAQKAEQNAHTGCSAEPTKKAAVGQGPETPVRQSSLRSKHGTRPSGSNTHIG